MLSADIDNAFKDKLLSVIIPAYNEADIIGQTIGRVLEYLRGKGWRYEVIVVDDGSTDATADVAAEAAGGAAAVSLLRNERNMGKGYTVRRGMLSARGDARIFTDADLSVPFEEIEKLIPHWQNGCGIAFGSRYVPGAKIEVHQSALREAMGLAFNILVRCHMLACFKDTQTGFKLFSSECAERVFRNQKLTDFAFDVELLFLARRYGFRIAEVPITVSNRSTSKINLLITPLVMFFELLKIRWNQICGRY
ncbi:MAG: dolichyl-phosphate beta-glucosyltransferase [bacterium]